jgi:glycosyltransferase involved in cell wall biosynthesis
MITDPSAVPLVSCIMLTRNRRAFVPQAIRYFQRQDYTNKELVILNDGSERWAGLVPDDPHIRYIRLSGRRALGGKRNECVLASDGDLLMQWDDDDWMAQHPFSYRTEAFLPEDAEVCGIQRMLFYDQ